MAVHELIEWRDEYSVGVASVDFEHRELIGLINKLYGNLLTSADRDAIGDFLGEVYAKISAHFALEEKIMRDRGYDEYDDHKRDHERLLDELSGIIDTFEDDRSFSSEELSQRLDRWFSVHFSTKDARLHKRLG